LPKGSFQTLSTLKESHKGSYSEPLEKGHPFREHLKV